MSCQGGGKTQRGVREKKKKKEKGRGSRLEKLKKGQ